MRLTRAHNARKFFRCQQMHDIAYIALGSNLGDRDEFLARARAALAALPHSRVVAESSVEETAPVSDVPQGAFLNQMVALDTGLSPRALLEALHRIEADAGRERTVHWGPRTLDLDIVRFGTHIVQEPDLVIPHPQLPNRDWWKRELAELGAAE
jgi:dihydroneopterin aldolase/2-amino-4-hydroxy-6-hydroxymethyldihydropteridine diphosphokinase